jgi:hypothetical protein
VVLGVIRQVVNETTDGAPYHVAVLVVAAGVAPGAGDRMGFALSPGVPEKCRLLYGVIIYRWIKSSLENYSA